MENLTLIGMYNYDNTLFDGLTLPDGIDKVIAVNTILMRSGEFELLYLNLDFLKEQITAWGKKHFRMLSKWVYALSQEYEPLYNYDRTEQTTDEEYKAGGESVNTQSASNTTGQDIVQQSVSAYDSTEFQPREQTADASGSSFTGSENIGRDSNENRTLTHNSRVYGNIGVTTSSKMLEEYIDVQRFNIYDNIADLFVDDFCIQVY